MNIFRRKKQWTDKFTSGIAVLGCAPGTCETDLMRPDALVDAVHVILLTGSSAFGGSGNMRSRWPEHTSLPSWANCGGGKAPPSASSPL
jgi:L-aminopeptidase/D-esterase-like protein